jgi:predicted ester cyclase
LDSYSVYPSAEDAVRPDAVDQVGRQRSRELLDVVLRAEFLAQHIGIAEALAADAYLSFSDYPDQVGPRGMIARSAVFASAFAPSEFAVTTELIGRDHAALRWLMTFEHHGDWAGLAATGRRVPVTGAAFVGFRDGKIIKWIEVIDLLSILRQLGGLSDVIPGCYPSQ